MADQSSWHQIKPYTFRNLLICLLVLYSLIAGFVSFAFAYMISRGDVREELVSKERITAVAMLELYQKTDLTMESIIQLSRDDALNISIVSPGVMPFDEEQMAILANESILCLDNDMTALPASYVKLDNTVVRITPTSGANMFVKSSLRVISTCISFLLVFMLFSVFSAPVMSKPITEMIHATR